MPPSRHVLAIPYPGRGHVNPMMLLSRQLITRGIHVTFVVTQEWLGLIKSSHPLPPPELNIMTIPNCILSEHGWAKDLVGFIKSVYTKMAEPFRELLDRLDTKPQAIIADMYLLWIVEVGNRRGIPESTSSDHLTWLDNQPENSPVLYISLGSFPSVSSSQFEEIAKGIHASAVKFLWVARENSSVVQERCGNNGLVVPWCDQLKILTHPSVGGFLTHCGFNSTLETLFARVPVLALPINWDQLCNSQLLTDEWKVSINLRDERWKEEEIFKDAVKKLMDLRDSESSEMRKRAADGSRAAKNPVKEGGSSFSSLDNFISEFIDV